MTFLLLCLFFILNCIIIFLIIFIIKMPYYTTQDGTKLYYEDVGKGETILFLHGLCSSHLKIKNFINEFKSEYRCVYYDHRGHESSDIPKFHINIQTLAKDLNEIIEYLNLKDITIIDIQLVQPLYLII